MTSNQLQAQNNEETIRHNKVMEKLTEQRDASDADYKEKMATISWQQAQLDKEYKQWSMKYQQAQGEAQINYWNQMARVEKDKADLQEQAQFWTRVHQQTQNALYAKQVEAELQYKEFMKSNQLVLNSMKWNELSNQQYANITSRMNAQTAQQQANTAKWIAETNYYDPDNRRIAQENINIRQKEATTDRIKVVTQSIIGGLNSFNSLLSTGLDYAATANGFGGAVQAKQAVRQFKSLFKE